MLENKLNALYRSIAETVNEMIPEPWEKFLFYAQVSETGGGTYFFYNSQNEPIHFKYSLEIPFEFDIDENEFDQNEMELFKLSEKMRDVFKDHDQEFFYSFTLSLERSGKLTVNFDYTDWFKTDYSFSDQLIIWKFLKIQFNKVGIMMLGKAYLKITDAIGKIIPSEWSKVVLYAEILDGSREVYFFFQTPENDEYIYSHDIPEQFQVSKKIYTELLLDLQELFKQLHNEFKENNPEAWTNLTLKLESTGTFSIDYDYEDVIESDLDEYERQIIWEFNNLGTFPEDEEDKEFVKDYLNIK